MVLKSIMFSACLAPAVITLQLEYLINKHKINCHNRYVNELNRTNLLRIVAKLVVLFQTIFFITSLSFHWGICQIIPGGKGLICVGRGDSSKSRKGTLYFVTEKLTVTLNLLYLTCTTFPRTTNCVKFHINTSRMISPWLLCTTK